MTALTFKGALFIEQGKICDQVAFVVSGKLRNFYFDEAGNEVTCYFVTLNNFVSAFSSFLTNAQTNEPVKPNRWGAEISPVGLAAFSITQAKATYLINLEKMCRTEVGLGFLIQPQSTRKANDAICLTQNSSQ